MIQRLFYKIQHRNKQPINSALLTISYSYFSLIFMPSWDYSFCLCGKLAECQPVPPSPPSSCPAAPVSSRWRCPPCSPPARPAGTAARPGRTGRAGSPALSSQSALFHTLLRRCSPILDVIYIILYTHPPTPLHSTPTPNPPPPTPLPGVQFSSSLLSAQSL